MATQTITPSTTFVTIDSLQSPFTTVVLSTIGFQGQTVTVLDRTASASVKNPILISSVTGTSTIIDQASGFVTLQTNGSSWSYLNTFPFWNQEISSGVSILTTSTLYTNINSTIVEKLDTMDVENIVITGLFPRNEAATFIQTLTVTGHSEFVSSFRANAAFTISSYLSTFSTLHLASSLTVGGPITIQSTLTTLSSFFVSSVVTATSLSTGLLTVAGNLLLSSIDLQQSTGTTLNIGGNLTVQKGLTVLSSVTTGNSVTADSLFVGSSLSTVTMVVGNNLFLSTNISTGNLFQNDSLTVTGLAHLYGTTTVVSSVNAYSTTMKHLLYLDNSLNASTASIQALRVVGTLSNLGQTSVSSQVSTLQNLNIAAFVASSTQLAVQGSFSTIGSLYDMANLTTVSSIQIQGSVSTPSTLTVGGNSLFRDALQVNGNIAFTSSITLVSSLNVLNTLSINTLLTRFSTTIIGNLNAASTVNVSGIAWLSSYSLPSAATVNQINVVSSLIAQGVLSTVTTTTPITYTITPQINSGSRSWFSIASSSDGMNLIAVVNGGYIYTSTDSGVNWSARLTDTTRSWYGCASSSDGTKLVAVHYTGYIYISTDSGVTWTQRATDTIRNWFSIASSSDGTKLVAVTYNGGYIYTSIDSGVTWTPQTNAGSRVWSGCASSSDGTKLVAIVALSGYIYTSTDSGVNWTARLTNISRGWTGIASSSDGTKLVAVANSTYGYIYTSTDSGVNWTERLTDTARNWRAVACSSDGTIIVACVIGGYSYISKDSGVTWALWLYDTTRNWISVTCSSDGMKIAMVNYNGYIYTGVGLGIPLYTSSLGIGYASTPYSVQLPYVILSQSALVSSLSTLQFAPYGFTRISTTMAIGMSSLGPGLDVGGLAKVNGSIYAFQTISSQKTYASTVAGYFYGDARGLSNFGLSTTIITSRLLISSLSTLNTSTGLFMGSSGSMLASLTLTSTLFFQSNAFINTTYGGNPQASTNQLLVYPYTQLQLNNSVYVVPGSNTPGKVGINTSMPLYTLHVEKSLAVGGIGGASIEFRSVQYDTLNMSTLTDGTNAYIKSGVLEMSNLLIDSTIDNNTYYVTTFAGSGTPTFADGKGIAASFNQPVGIAVDSAFNVYVSDTFNHSIRKITPSGLVTTIAGNGNLGYSDGTGLDARFNSPTGITIDPLSNLYVADYKNNRIRKVTPAGVVTTLAGSGIPAFLDGQGQAASFYWPSGITIDSAGNLYVADSANNRIRKIDTALNVTTIAGNASATYTDGFGITASFNSPYSITIDNSNNLYVGDQMNYRIRKIDSGANVTTIVGNGTPGYLDGNGTSAQVSYVNGLYYDRSILYFTDAYNNTIRSYSPSGAVSTIGGNGIPGFLGNTNGVGLSSRFNMPSGIAIDSTGTLYIDDQSNNTVRKMIPKYQVHSNTNRIQAIQSTLNVNNLMYLGQSTVGIGVSSPKYTLDAYSLGTASNFTTYTTEVNATIQVNPNEKSVWVATSATDLAQTSNFTYSLDHGTTWSDGNDQQLWNLTKGAAYNGSYWVSPGNPIMTSTDGSIWNSVVAQGGSGSFLTGGGKVAWNGSYWLAAGPSSNRQGTLLKSQDGINWTSSITGGFTTGSVFQGSDILWTGTQWVATGLGANAVSSIQLSQDGVNWSSARSGGFTTGGNGLSFGPRIPYEKGFERYQGNQLLFAVGNDSLLNSIQYSYDGGFNWSTITSGGFYTKGNAIDTDGKYLIAVGKDTFSQSNIQIGTIQTNPFKVIFTDYNSYTGNTIYPFDNNGNCVKWNGSEWLLGGNNGLRKLIPTSNSYFSSITVQGILSIGRILATDQNSITSLPTYSIDNGVTYEKSPPVYTGFRNGLLKSNGSNLWVTIGNTHPAAWYSVDGVQWTQITNIPFNRNGQNPYFLTFTNNRWFLTSYDTTNNYSTLCTSVDGVNWSNLPTLDSQVVFNIMYGVGTAGGIYVAANSYALRYSYDLVTWNNVQGQTGTDGVWYNGKCVFGEGVFIVSGSSEPFGNLGNSWQVNAGHVDGSDNTGRYDYLAKNGRPYIRSTDGINWSYLYFTPNFNWNPYVNGYNVWGPQVLSYSSNLGQFLTGGVLRSSGCQSWSNGIYLFYSPDGTTWNPCMRVKSDPAIGLIYPWDAFYLIDKWILSVWNLGEAGYTAATAFYPFWYSTDGITFSNYSIFPSPVNTGYNLSGFAQDVPVLSNETYGVAYTSNLIPLVNTSSFSVFTNTDINTIHSQTTNNTMHVTSNTIVLNDLFTVTDKVVNFGSYPLDYTIAKQSSLSIFQNIEITGSLSTGSAIISSLYLGIQSV